MLSILILVLATTAINTKDYRLDFDAAYAKFSARDGLLRSEPPAVHLQRYASFCKFAKTVDDVNANNELTFSAENNFLSILTDEEKKSYLGVNLTGHFHEEKTNKPKLLTVGQVAESRDFSKKIGPVKDQGNCGSCWTYAATAALEGEIYFTNSIEDVSLSEQEYMECSTTSDGCSGGWMEWCYDYSKDSGRIAPSTAYPYEQKDTMRCRASGKANALMDTNTKVTGNIKISGDAELLTYANKHIVSVAIKVVSTFHSYKKGIFNDKSCNEQPVNHAVAVVGYESEFWLVRNSWGAGWGDDGYIKMSRKINNICHISTHSHIPKVECRDNSCTAPVIDNDDGGDEESDGDECVDLETSCPSWAQSGYCEHAKYGAYMLENCLKSCSSCETNDNDDGDDADDECVDLETSCPSWAQSGYCDDAAYGAYMIENCPKSCSSCENNDNDDEDDAGDECVDLETSCPSWAQSGYCNDATYRAYMLENCPESCNSCENNEDDDGDDKDDGDDNDDSGDDENDGDDEGDNDGDGKDDGDDKDDGSDKEDICKIQVVRLGKCIKTEKLALEECENNAIPENKCVVTKVANCYFTNSAGSDFVEYYGPCKDEGSDGKDDDGGDDNDDENSEGCDANAGLVMCNDCNCCIHKHMCDNPA